MLVIQSQCFPKIWSSALWMHAGLIPVACRISSIVLLSTRHVLVERVARLDEDLARRLCPAERRLDDPDEHQLRHLEDREEGGDDRGAVVPPVRSGEQLLEGGPAPEPE